MADKQCRGTVGEQPGVAHIKGDAAQVVAFGDGIGHHVFGVDELFVLGHPVIGGVGQVHGGGDGLGVVDGAVQGDDNLRIGRDLHLRGERPEGAGGGNPVGVLVDKLAVFAVELVVALGVVGEEHSNDHVGGIGLDVGVVVQDDIGVVGIRPAGLFRAAGTVNFLDDNLLGGHLLEGEVEGGRVFLQYGERVGAAGIGQALAVFTGDIGAGGAVDARFYQERGFSGSIGLAFQGKADVGVLQGDGEIGHGEVVPVADQLQSNGYGFRVLRGFIAGR